MTISDTPGKLKIIVFAVFLLFAILGARLWQLQIIEGEEFVRLSRDNRLRYEILPAPRGIIYDRNGKPLVKNSPYYFVALLPEMQGKADLSSIGEFLNMSPMEVTSIVGAVKDPLQPIRIKGGLKPNEVAFIEARISDHPGLIIVAEETRHYLYGSIGAHLIGYLGKLNPQQASRKRYRNVPRQAFIGQWGIEKMYGSTLRGKPGRRIIEVDALGRKLQILGEEPPVKGSDVYLSIDIDLQKAADEAFEGRNGALVAINPNTGEILALVSRPSFDPNLFSRGIDYDQWLKLRDDKRYPLLNRALQSHFPPGSTFKIVTALAALETGKYKPYNKHTCTGSHRKGRWNFRCWRRGGHGTLNFKQAIVQSCDVFFYRTGEKVGIDAIAKYARKLGLGAPTGLNLIKEKSGLIPDKKWKLDTRGESWYPGETYNAAIGQGFVLTTPIQLAQMTSILVTGGLKYSLRLLRADEQPEPIEDLALSEKNVAFLLDALRAVVNTKDGTGRAANSRFVKVGGKTGTAQVVSSKKIKTKDRPEHLRDHAWFVAFAPYKDPKIAMAVFVENGGHGGTTAAPIARKAIEAYLAKNRVTAMPKQAPLKKSIVNKPASTEPVASWDALVTGSDNAVNTPSNTPVSEPTKVNNSPAGDRGVHNSPAILEQDNTPKVYQAPESSPKTDTAPATNTPIKENTQ